MTSRQTQVYRDLPSRSVFESGATETHRRHLRARRSWKGVRWVPDKGMASRRSQIRYAVLDRSRRRNGAMQAHRRRPKVLSIRKEFEIGSAKEDGGALLSNALRYIRSQQKKKWRYVSSSP